MKKFFKLHFPKAYSLIIILIFTFLMSFQGISAKDKIWQTSILKAMEIAKKENKPIFLELYADWCTICKSLEKNILPDPSVQNVLDDYILVRLNGEEFPNLMERYEVQGFPTLLFLDKYANYIQKLSGMPSKELLIREAKLAHKNSNLESKLIAAWKKNPNLAQTNFELAVYFYQKEELSKSVELFTQASQKAKKSEWDLKRQSNYNIALITMNQGKYKEAIGLWQNYIKSYAKAPQLSGAYFHRGICYKELKENSKAKLDFKKATAISPDEEEKKIIREEWNSI